MPTATIDAVEVVNDLLQKERAGAFHFMAEADAYIRRASAELRKPLAAMIANSQALENELAALLDELGRTPPPTPVNPEHQYMAFLTLDSLLPKLREAKLISIENYRAAIAQLDNSEPAVAMILQEHMDAHRTDIRILENAIKGIKA